MKGYIPVPLGTRIRVLSIVQSQTTAGGIVLPEKALETYNFGRIMQVGPDVKQDLHSGDLVMFLPFAGTILSTWEGQLIVDERDIIAKLVKEQ